jgi:hypothetical protein
MEMLFVGLLGPVVGLVVLYWVIRTAVRDGILAAAARTATPLTVERAPDQRV